MLQRTLCALVVVCAVGCGGGEPIEIEEEAPGGLIRVKVSVGAPLEGVDAVVYAIDPVSGKPIEGRSGGPILAEASGASVAGALELRLADDASWDGPIQVVVTGNGVTYTDPTSEAILTKVSLPGSFQLSSYVQRFRSGTEITVPVTLYTSLADAAVTAYALGKNPSSTSKRPLEQAMPLVDDLLVKHLSRPATWDLRTTVPVDLNGDVGGLRDVVYAALPDLALNQMARDICVSIGQQPGSSVTAYSLLELLRKDISDGVFDGKQEGTPLTSGRSPAYGLSADTTRLDLAKALDTYVASGQNRTGLTRSGLQGFGVFDNIALDQSILYPQDESPPGFDNVPPEVSFTLSFRTADGSSVTPSAIQGAVVAGTVTVVANAKDPSGVANVRVALEDGRFLTLSSETTNTRFVGSFDVSADPDGPLRFVATAVDMLGNTGTQVLQVRVDNTKPVLNVTAPVEGTYYSGALPVNATAVDPHVTSSATVGLSGFVDTVAAPETLKGQVDLAAYEDGPIPVHLRACDAAKNCAEREVSVAVDTTMPTIELEEPLPKYAPAGPFVVRLRASDAGAGVSAVKWAVRGEPRGSVSKDGDVWVLNLELTDGENEVSIWAEDAAVPANSGRGVSAPHGAEGTVIKDAQAPSIGPTDFLAYVSEANATLKIGPDGLPVVPGALRTKGSKVSLTPSPTTSTPTIQKTYVTSSWGDRPPSSAELEDNNPHNLPFQQFAVSYDPKTDSDIKAVTWRIRASVDNFLTWHESEGEAIPSAREPAGGFVFFNVVFSRDTIPFLNETTHRKTELQLYVKVTDLAGNWRETKAIDHTYELLDTPLHYVVDDGYAVGGDNASPASIYAYRSQSEGYFNLFNSAGGSNFPGDAGTESGEVARVGRITVYNPWPVPVAVRTASSTTYRISETWTNHLTAIHAEEGQPADVVTIGTATFPRYEIWDSTTEGIPDVPECASARARYGGSPCGRGWWNTKRVQYTLGASGLTCETGTLGDSSAWSHTLRITHASTLYFRPGSSSPASRFDDALPDDNKGSAIVPAAGEVAGQVDIYPGVLRQFGRGGWSVAFQQIDDLPKGHNELMGGVYVRQANAIRACTVDGSAVPDAAPGPGPGPGPSPSTDYFAHRYEMRRWVRSLSSARSTTYGEALAFSARPIYADGDWMKEAGPPPAPQTVPFSIGFDH